MAPVTTPSAPPQNVPDLILDQNQNIIAEPQQVDRNVITSAQLLTLKSGGGVNLVPAPGPGLVIDVQSVTVRFLFNTTAYTLNVGTLKLFYGPPANGFALTPDLSTILTSVANSNNVGVPGLATGNMTDAQALNQPIFLGNTGTADFTLGDGILVVDVVFVVKQA